MRTYFDSSSSFVDRRNKLQDFSAPECFPAPFCANFGSRAFTVVNISCAKTFLGSLESVWSQDVFPNTQVDATAKANAVPTNMIIIRGGNDFLSGMLGESRTFTTGISLTSWTLAISYSLVRASNTAS